MTATESENPVAAGDAASDQNVPLIVDLDGTLCCNDTLHDALLEYVAEQPLRLFAVLRWMLSGRIELKIRLSEHHLLEPKLLPYNSCVLELIRSARAQGRPVLLVSATHQTQVDAVSGHLDLFDQAIGTGHAEASPGQNLKGKAKAEYLEERFGTGGFSYVGDGRADLPTWKVARTAYAVAPSARLTRNAAEFGIELVQVGPPAHPRWRVLLEAARPHQWAKNLLVLLPVLAALDASALGSAVLALIFLSLVASAGYFVNDLLDIRADRIHPRKRARAFASGRLSVGAGAICAAALLVLSFTGAALSLPPVFLLCLAVYLASTLTYSFVLKGKLLVDVIALGALYTLRIVAGAAATGIELSYWLLVFSMFLFFSLATIKRQAELVDLKSVGETRSPARNLETKDLSVFIAMSVSAAQASVLVFALYANDTTTHAAYAEPYSLLFVCPILFFWLARLQILTNRGFMTDDPLVFALRDRISLLCFLSILGVVAAAAIGVTS